MLNEVAILQGTDQFMNEVNQDSSPKAMKGLVEAAKAYGEEVVAIKLIESQLKKRKADNSVAELALHDMFMAVGITSIKAGGESFFTRTDIYASVDASQKEVAYKWIKVIGCDYLITEAVNAQSLTREIKAYIEDGGEAPGEDQGIKLRTVNRVCAPKR